MATATATDQPEQFARLLTVADVACSLGVSESSVRRWIRVGDDAVAHARERARRADTAASRSLDHLRASLIEAARRGLVAGAPLGRLDGLGAAKRAACAYVFAIAGVRAL